jgi:hypothetical protein
MQACGGWFVTAVEVCGMRSFQFANAEKNTSITGDFLTFY